MATINDYLMGRCNVGFSNNGPVRVEAIFQTTSHSLVPENYQDFCTELHYFLQRMQDEQDSKGCENFLHDNEIRSLILIFFF